MPGLASDWMEAASVALRDADWTHKAPHAAILQSTADLIAELDTKATDGVLGRDTMYALAHVRSAVDAALIAARALA